MAAVNPANVLNLLAGEFHRSSVTNPTARDIEVKDRILGESSVNLCSLIHTPNPPKS